MFKNSYNFTVWNWSYEVMVLQTYTMYCLKYFFRLYNKVEQYFVGAVLGRE